MTPGLYGLTTTQSKVPSSPSGRPLSGSGGQSRDGRLLNPAGPWRGPSVALLPARWASVSRPGTFEVIVVDAGTVPGTPRSSLDSWSWDLHWDCGTPEPLPPVSVPLERVHRLD